MSATSDPYGTPADAPWVLGAMIEQSAERSGDRVAVEVAGLTRTYAELHERSDRISAGLRQLGLEAGDRVCLMMDNDVANIDVWFGLCKAGVVEVPVNTANRGYLLTWIISQSGATALVCDAQYLPRVAEIAEDLPDLRHVIVHAGSPTDAAGNLTSQRGTSPPGGEPHLPAGNLTSPAGNLTDTGLPPRMTLHALEDLYADGPAWRADLSASDPSVILYTSGTTGPSKGVVLSHRMNLMAARHTAWLCRYGRDDLLYTVFHLFHINAKYTSVLAAMVADASLIMDNRFSASGFMQTCRDRGITAFNYQGALLTMLMKQPPQPDDADNPVTRAFGAPAPVEIWEDFEQRFGLRLIEVYGMTETSISLQNTLDDTRIGTCGKPSPHFEVEIHDEQDNVCDVDVAGEIVVRPKYPDVMISEYHGMPEETLHAFRNLWFHTGDRARMDADGYVTFIDRMKDAIRRRGENISSFEVERVINTHDDVIESAAYGVPSELSEEEVMVAVVPRPDADLDPLDLVRFCNDHMAHFAVPRYVRLLAELPKTPSQRIQKYRLREDGITPDTWDRETTDFTITR
ncbi:AMP-binding protein [Euzebya tangerina]|uniref:AMP-binding protein n=1 Tax=Euzebya tangerina TaxID=591198 RepID=UPI002F2DDA65